MKHRLSFITLTIPDGKELLTAAQGYDRLLKHFLQWLRRTEGAVTYVWKAELQKRGQLHYHITTPTWIHYQRIKDKWNNLLRREGLLDEFRAKYGHDNPNSTDIHEVRKIKDLAGYLVKEFCKTLQNNIAVNGKIWDASENLKAGKYFSIEMTESHCIKLSELQTTQQITEYVGERFTMFKFSQDNVMSLLSADEKTMFRDFLNKLRRYSDNDLFTRQNSTQEKDTAAPRSIVTAPKPKTEQLSIAV